MSENQDTRDYTVYADKTPTSLQDHFSKWIQWKTGYKASDEVEFAKAVQLAVTLYADFQASPDNAKRKADERRIKDEQAARKVQEAAEARKVQDEKDRKAEELATQVEVEVKASPKAKKGRAKPKAQVTDVPETDAEVDKILDEATTVAA